MVMKQETKSLEVVTWELPSHNTNTKMPKTNNEKKVTALRPVLKWMPFSTGSLLNLKTIMAKISTFQKSSV